MNHDHAALEQVSGLMDAGYFLGIDAGGSQCRARLQDRAGALLGEGRAGAANFRIGAKAVAAAVMAATGEALAAAGLADAVLADTIAGLGIAGIERRGAAAALAAQALPFRRIVIATDAEIAHWGAHDGADGGTIAVGTGSVGMATQNGETWRLGGYGFPISDRGSGAELGLEAMRAALSAWDAISPTGPLTQEIMDRFGGDITAIIAWLDGASATDYASLAPLVVRHAGQGDRCARAIMTQAAAAIGAMIEAMRGRGVRSVALVGGLGAVLAAWLAPALQECLVAPRGDALAGALLLARRPAQQ